MSYNKKIWANGDLITKERMNNIENGIYDAHDKINTINNKVEENTTDTNTTKQDINTAKQDISDIKLQIGTEELTTTSKKIKGAINELDSQIEDIDNQKATKIEVGMERKRIDSLTTLAEGSTTGDAELIDARIGTDGITYNNVGGAIRGQFNKFDKLLNDCFQIENTLSFTSISSCYISKNSYKITDPTPFSMSEPIHLEKGKTIVLYGQGYNTQVSMIATCDSDGSNIKAQVISTDSTLKEYSYTATNDCYVLLSYNNTVAGTYATIKIDYYNKINEIESNMNTQTVDDSTNYMQIFHKIAGIGDSLMSGELGYWDSEQNKSVYVDCYKYSWLSNICKNIGAEAVHYSCGGRTAKKWLAWDLNTMKAETVKPSAYFIALGTNDIVSGTLGTISDCGSDTADTFYSNYAKIITEVKSFNPKAKIFCFSLYFKINNDNFESYNNAIKAIANKYNVYYVDFYNEYKHDQYNSTLIQFGHFTADGYVKIAEQIQKMINKIIKNNHDDFKLLPIDFLDL